MTAGRPENANASVDSEPMLLYARLRGHVSASGPVVPFFGKRDVPFHRRRRADWLEGLLSSNVYILTVPDASAISAIQ